MFSFDFLGLIKLDLLLDCFSDLYRIPKTLIKDFEDLASENSHPRSHYEYYSFDIGEFKTRFHFHPHVSYKKNVCYETELYLQAWILSQKLNTEIIVSPTNDIIIPYQWFLIKDGVFYLATEIIPDDSDDQDYGMIIDYTTLEPVFDKLPKDVQDYILANTPKV